MSTFNPFGPTGLGQVKPRVFLSFRAEDRDHVNGLRLLAANPNYELDFYDESLRSAINSAQADYIKRLIREKIRRASVTLCLVSELTHTSRWVNWELKESLSQGKHVVAMAVKNVTSAILPAPIRGGPITFHAWNPSGLDQLLRNA